MLALAESKRCDVVRFVAPAVTRAQPASALFGVLVRPACCVRHVSWRSLMLMLLMKVPRDASWLSQLVDACRRAAAESAAVAYGAGGGGREAAVFLFFSSSLSSPKALEPSASCGLEEGRSPLRGRKQRGRGVCSGRTALRASSCMVCRRRWCCCTCSTSAAGSADGAHIREVPLGDRSQAWRLA